MKSKGNDGQKISPIIVTSAGAYEIIEHAIQ